MPPCKRKFYDVLPQVTAKRDSVQNEEFHGPSAPTRKAHGTHRAWISLSVQKTCFAVSPANINSCSTFSFVEVTS